MDSFDDVSMGGLGDSSTRNAVIHARRPLSGYTVVVDIHGQPVGAQQVPKSSIR